MLINYDLNETLRYLGYRGVSADEQTEALIESVYRELCGVIQPKYIYKIYDCKKNDEGVTVGGVFFKSRKLSAHLKSAEKIALFGATLGRGADVLVKKYSLTDSARAAVIQATAASMTEDLCDKGCTDLQRSTAMILRPRFSPGYGDLDLSTQRDFFTLLDMSKRLGVSLSDSCIMTPSKSVTAFVGLVSNPQ